MRSEPAPEPVLARPRIRRGHLRVRDVRRQVGALKLYVGPNTSPPNLGDDIAELVDQIVLADPVGAGIGDHRERHGHVAGVGGTVATCSIAYPVVPRMPMVATGVSIFMSPVWATLPATNENEPSTRLTSALLPDVAFGSYDVIVERHPRIGDEIERGAVGKADADLRIGAGLDDVALVDFVADIERDFDAVAHAP